MKKASRILKYRIVKQTTSLVSAIILGAGCSKLMTSLVNVSLKCQT